MTDSRGLGNSVRIFIAAIVGGIGSTMGALLGSLFLRTIWWLAAIGASLQRDSVLTVLPLHQVA